MDSTRLRWAVEGLRGAFNLIFEDGQKRREGCSGRGSSVSTGLEERQGPGAWAAERPESQVKGLGQSRAPQVVVTFPLSHMLHSWDLASLFSCLLPPARAQVRGALSIP